MNSFSCAASLLPRGLWELCTAVHIDAMQLLLHSIHKAAIPSQRRFISPDVHISAPGNNILPLKLPGPIQRSSGIPCCSNNTIRCTRASPYTQRYKHFRATTRQTAAKLCSLQCTKAGPARQCINTTGRPAGRGLPNGGCPLPNQARHSILVRVVQQPSHLSTAL